MLKQCLFILCSILFTQWAYADRTHEGLPNTLHFVVIELPPYGCTSNGATPRCFQNKLLQRLDEIIDHNIKVSVMPYPRAQEAIMSGTVDFMMTLDIEHVKEQADIQFKITDIDITLYRWHSAETFDASTPWRLGFLRSAHYGDDVLKIPNVQPYPVLHFQQAVNMFAKYRLDGIVGPTVLFDILLQQQGIMPQDLWQPLENWPMGIYLYCRKSLCDKEALQWLQRKWHGISPAERKIMMQQAINSELNQVALEPTASDPSLKHPW